MALGVVEGCIAKSEAILLQRNSLEAQVQPPISQFPRFLFFMNNPVNIRPDQIQVPIGKEGSDEYACTAD